MSLRKLVYLTALLGAESLAVFCGGESGHTALAEAPPAPSPTTAPAATVKIDNFTFSPQTLTITAGTRVTWINHDDVPHTATSVTKIFKSPALDTDEKFSFVFTAPGTYAYFCAIHPHMTGRVIVRQPGTGTTTVEQSQP